MENAKTKRSRVAPVLIAALAVLIFTAVAHAQTLSLMAPAIANVNGALTARFGVTVVELPILKGELEDGAELILRCDIELSEVIDYWLNNGIAETAFESTLKYESLTKEFVMTLPGRNTPLKNTSLESLLREGWGTIEATLGPWNMLERGQEYSLSLNTTMNEVGAPEGVSRFIYFWSWDAGADTTFLLNFTY
ncbi:DUF4390 domain-containing protein [Pseudodesulfovibrio sp.]|nr:DUF4390 domain-containing protein [Pseudodesulfovibrio sp.]